MIQHPTSVVRSLIGLQTPNESDCAFDCACTELVANVQVKTADVNSRQHLVVNFMIWPSGQAESTVSIHPGRVSFEDQKPWPQSRTELRMSSNSKIDSARVTGNPGVETNRHVGYNDLARKGELLTNGKRPLPISG